MTEPRSRASLLYDADCGFCRWGIDKILTLDRRRSFRAVPIQGGEGDRLLREIPPDRRLGSWHIVTPDGAVSSAGAALPPLFDRLPGGRAPAALFRRFPGLAEGLYGLIADNRSALSKVRSLPGRPRSR